MSLTSERHTTSILLIDGSAADRAFYAAGLKSRFCDYEIIEATDRQSGRDIYQSRQIDCVVLELALPDHSGFQILLDLVPRLSRPHIAVIVLTQITHRGVREAAKQNGVYACLLKQDTSGQDLERAIQDAVSSARCNTKPH
jgi:CheY-like chemotaxis protein